MGCRAGLLVLRWAAVSTGGGARREEMETRYLVDALKHFG